MASRKDVYTDEEKAEIAAYVLVQVASGRFVSRVFREDKTTSNGVKLPAKMIFWKWVVEDSTGELEIKLVRAREHGIEALLDETTEIADAIDSDTITDDEGRERPNTEWISRSRLRIETRIKLAQMMKPKKYGPKLDLTSGGEKLGYADKLEAARKREAERLKDGE